MSKVDIIGGNNIRNKGALVIPNKLSAQDVFSVESEAGASRVTYVLLEGYEPSAEVQAALSRPGVEGIMLSSGDPDPLAVGETLKASLEEGRLLVYVPGDTLVHKGTLNTNPVCVLDFLCQLGLPVVPLFVGRYGESGEQQEDEPLAQTILNFKEVLPRKGIKAVSCLLQSWLEAGEAGMSSQAVFEGSLASAIVRGMKNNPQSKIVDGVDEKELPYNTLLGVAIALSKRLKELTSKRRVGVILPPGKGAILANLACVLAGKIPVNINFTVSERSVKSSIDQADLDRVITAGPFMKKFPDFFWPPERDLILLEKESESLKKSAKRWVILSRLMPAAALIKILNLDSRKGEDEAVLIFTSGSSGLPKGVPLSHRNILGNIYQCHSRIGLGKNSRLLGSLPVFHSFGITLGMWFPLICGHDVVTYPSPRESRRLGELIEKYKIKLAIFTPTFLRGIIKRVPKESLKSVDHMLVGAEKLSPALSDSFYDKFGFYPLEGYGLTEATPVCSVNMLTPEEEGRRSLSSEKKGTVGQTLPGIAVRITEPESEEPYPLTKTGMIWLKGVNIFSGYLNQEELNRKIFKEGWLCTGDVGHMDPQGFLHIEGRISRFSKIAGEMVPHEQLEIAIMKAMGVDPADSERHIAVVSIPDKQKGEAIVLLSTEVGPAVHQELLMLRYKLLDLGIPALWCPKYMLGVPAIPLFNSGKLNIPECQAIVKLAMDRDEI